MGDDRDSRVIKKELPLDCFGPPVLREWLYQEWDALSEESRNGLKELIFHDGLHRDVSLVDNVRYLATKLDYAHILAALSNFDFERFIAEILKDNTRCSVFLYEPGLDDIQEPLPRLRQRLRRHFAHNELYPREDFRYLIGIAKHELAIALNKIPFTGREKNVFDRKSAVTYVHSTIDRAMLVGEQFVELVREFLVCLLLELGLTNQDDADRWLSNNEHTKKGEKSARSKSFRRKIYDVNEIADIIVDNKHEVEKNAPKSLSFVMTGASLLTKG